MRRTKEGVWLEQDVGLKIYLVTERVVRVTPEADYNDSLSKFREANVKNGRQELGVWWWRRVWCGSGWLKGNANGGFVTSRSSGCNVIHIHKRDHHMIF